MNIIAMGERVYLREVSLDDAPFMYDLMNQQAWIEFIGDRDITSLDKAKDHIESGPMLSYRVHGFGLYLVIIKGNDKPVGACGLLKRTYLDAPDLGFAISERYYRQGFGYEAATLVLKAAKTLTNADLIYASVNKANVGSCNLLKKLGFNLYPLAALKSLGSEADNLLLFAKDINRQGQ